MTCEQARALLPGWVDRAGGGLTDDERERLAAHLDTCAGCAAQRDAFERTSAMVRALPSGDLPWEVEARLIGIGRRAAGATPAGLGGHAAVEDAFEQFERTFYSRGGTGASDGPPPDIGDDDQDADNGRAHVVRLLSLPESVLSRLRDQATPSLDDLVQAPAPPRPTGPVASPQAVSAARRGSGFRRAVIVSVALLLALLALFALW